MHPHLAWFSISTHRHILPPLEYHNAAHVRILLPRPNECPALAQTTAKARTRSASPPERRRNKSTAEAEFRWTRDAAADLFDLKVLRVEPKRPRASGGGRVNVNSGTCGCQSTPRHIHHRPSSGTTVLSEPVLVDVESHNGGNEAYMLNRRSRTNRYAVLSRMFPRILGTDLISVQHLARPPREGPTRMLLPALALT